MGKAMCIVAAALAMMFPAAAHGSWVHIPQPVLVQEADYVVVGKIVRIEPDKALEEQRLALGVVKVAEQLKGDTAAEVKIVFDSGVGPIHSAMTVRKVGDEGVWILKKMKDKDYCDSRFPLVYRPLDEKEIVAKLVKDLAALKFSEPVNGLAAAALITNWQVYIWIKNTSDKPLRWNDYPGDQSVRLQMKDVKGGKTQEINLYSWLAAGRLAARRKENFNVLEPGKSVLVLGTGGNVPIQGAGDYEFTCAYTNQQSGKEFGLADVWVGAVAAPPIRMTR